MSDSRLIITTGNNNEGHAIVNWSQVPDDEIRYDTDDEEEVMKAKSKERKRQKAAEQAQQEEQAWLEAERVVREKAKAKKAAQEAKEKRIYGNKKQVACVWCNLLKGKCQWPGDGKDAEDSSKAEGKVDKGKKWKIDDEGIEARPSKQKQAKTSARPVEVLELNESKAGGSRSHKTSAEHYSGLEEKLECLIDMAGLIANNLASLFELHETTVKNLGHIADMLKSLLNKSYSFRMVVSPLDLGSSELDSDELHEEADWLKAHGKDEEEESSGDDETMAEAE
ncbi:hypothetical protein M404DRAFT_32908 [Pisolithus tinctorius Marx 270]|uniref:Uncharacterized protein n=1 Tax=Pisolithus tinctorius Marx 270 TaxID=870435 RepID=A0A0C3JGZ2_PISTI|nr:hypothetical protein M404DRAFT_32908 [Pisolithus tinctorius Marx 270]